MTRLKKVLINATNLNEGGGVQVATSFLKDLVSHRKPEGMVLSVYVSPAVNRNLENNHFNKNLFLEYRIVDKKSISFLNSYRLNNYDIVFTVFGPVYLPIFKNTHISGFAQPWLIHPVNDVLKKISFLKSLFFRAKYFLASYIFRRADMLIVESDYIKDLLLKKSYRNRIEVVENAISSIFFNQDEWQSISSPVIRSKKINIGILSGGYAHKNLDFIIKLARKLEVIYPNTFNFIFTLSPDKFDALTKLDKLTSISNLGSISLQQCPSFYEQIDGLMLPSFLECFSITPYEAMLMNKIIFLSDRDFFKVLCLNHAMYFDPLSVDTAINVLEEWYFRKNHDAKVSHLNSAYNFVYSRGHSNLKTGAYLKLINEVF